MKELDPINIPLEGTHIIEASAGTGKTYAISNIFLRFVLEKALPVEKILIVSFTEAATNELKHRIRRRIQEAIYAFDNESNDDFLRKLSKRVKDKAFGIELLKGAIRELDSLTISTIHGFCRSIITDNALESGVFLDTRLIVDQESIKKEIIYDFWRTHLYNESPLLIDYLTKNRFDPEDLNFLIDAYLTRPYVKIIPETRLEDISAYEREYKEILNEVFQEWIHSRDEIEGILKNHKGLSRNVYKERQIENWMEYMDQFMNSMGYEFGSSDVLKRFSKDYISSFTKKGYSPPEHPFFDLCNKLIHIQNRLEELYKNKLIALRAGLIRYLDKELKKRKITKNLVSFDDLIMVVYKGLMEHRPLLNAIRERFFVAMIDEFQDTDPIQYAIFKNIFDSEDHALYLIGDPKQSIYSFRGADIFTYIKASKEIRSKFTLKENWRSYPALIESINRIFLKNKRPFFYEEISFFPARPSKESNIEPLYLDNNLVPCLRLWLFDEDDYDNKSEIRENISKIVAEEISKLLHLGKENRLFIGNRPVKASDIAVLVRRNSEAKIIQEELCRLHIPTVLYSTTNIFGSWECKEIQSILYGIYQYNNEAYLKAALGTDMIGLKGEEMERQDEAEWERWIERFKGYHELWNKYGFLYMFREFLNKESVLSRIMRFPDGERRCTNILHLMEAIHNTEKENMLSMEGIIKWLSDQKEEQFSRLEEYQLRLESDESAVKVITIHRSKGLEFPIVFLPFAWEAIYKTKSVHAPVIFHDPENKLGSILDIGSEKREDNRRLEIQESLAEDIRLLYVGLTRAKNCCYLIWGKTKDSVRSALSYLFYHDGNLNGDIMDEIRERFDRVDSEKEIKKIFYGMEKQVDISHVPSVGEGYEHFEEKEERFTCRTFSGSIDRSWHITSFSSLISNKLEIEEAQDIDKLVVQEEEEEILKEPSLDIFSFPKGARAGTFFHDLLEHLDFTEKEEGIRQIILSKLNEYGFEQVWENTIYDTTKRLLDLPIDPEEEGLRFSRIPMKNRINELEFYFPLKRITPEIIEQLLREYELIDTNLNIPNEIGRLRFDPVEGFMRGFIDMVFFWNKRFFLVDWKSNFLGDKITDYEVNSLSKVMKKELYTLQYLIYTVALDQYLRSTISDYNYEKDFGKVYYVFLRGIDPQKGPNFGIYKDRPDPKLIVTLREILIDHV